MPEFTIADLGSAINQLNSQSIGLMVDLARAAGGKLDVQNDTVVNIKDANGKDSNGKIGDHVFIGGIDIGKISTIGSDGKVGVDVEAGSLVQLQFKIDQMMASVQEGIKNSGKVSQTREGAARA